MGGSDTLTRCALRGVRGCVVLPSTLLELGPLVMSAGSNHRASSEVSTLSCQTSVAAKPKGEASTWAEKRRAGYRYGMKKVGPNSFRYPKSDLPIYEKYFCVLDPESPRQVPEQNNRRPGFHQNDVGHRTDANRHDRTAYDDRDPTTCVPRPGAIPYAASAIARSVA